MATLTFWSMRCKDDNECYSLVGKTKKAVLEQHAKHGSPDSFEAPEKQVIHYADAFDLMDQLTCEGGGRCDNNE